MEIYPHFKEAAQTMGNEGVRVGSSCFINYKAYISEEVEYVNINEAEEGTVIKFYGTNSAAYYTLVIMKDEEGGKRVWAWRDTNAPNLDCALENIVSYKGREDESFRVERGILRKGDRFAMPYFKYKFQDDDKETVHPDQTGEYQWMDKYERIEILQLPKP